MQAILLAGGFGTRLRPLTLTTPKQMLPLVHRPMIEHVVAGLARHGVDRVVLALGYRDDAFRAAYPDGLCAGVELRCAVEPAPLGTAGAMRFAHEACNTSDSGGPVLVANGDVLTDLDISQMVSRHRAVGAQATIHLISVKDPSRYGLVEADATGRVSAFLEKPASPRDKPDTLQEKLEGLHDKSQWHSEGLDDRSRWHSKELDDRSRWHSEELDDRSRWHSEGLDDRSREQSQQAVSRSVGYWINAGSYVMEPAVIKGIRADRAVSVEREVFPRMASQGTLWAFRQDTYWVDAGTPQTYLQAQFDLLEGRRGRAVEGVSPQACVEPGAVVERSVVMADAIVASGALVQDSAVHAKAVVGAGASVRQSVVGAGASIGPCASLNRTLVGAGFQVTADASVCDARLPESS